MHSRTTTDGFRRRHGAGPAGRQGERWPGWAVQQGPRQGPKQEPRPLPGRFGICRGAPTALSSAPRDFYREVLRRHVVGHVVLSRALKISATATRKINSMDVVLYHLTTVAVVAVFLVLVAGLWTMSRGTAPNLSQKLMRWRVGLQFAAIVVIMVFTFLSRHTAG